MVGRGRWSRLPRLITYTSGTLANFGADARTDKLAHRAHGVQRSAEAGTAVGNQWYRYRRCNVAGDTDLFIHGQQRLRRAARATNYKAAGIHRRKSKAHDQTSADRVIG